MVSRMQVAAGVADQMEAGRAQAVKSAAAWLVDHGRIREARYLARDVAAILADRGYLLVNVTTARPLDEGARQKIVAFIKEQTGARELELVATVDKSLIGGVQIETPLAALDASVRTKLARMLEGVMN